MILSARGSRQYIGYCCVDMPGRSAKQLSYIWRIGAWGTLITTPVSAVKQVLNCCVITGLWKLAYLSVSCAETWLYAGRVKGRRVIRFYRVTLSTWIEMCICILFFWAYSFKIRFFCGDFSPNIIADKKYFYLLPPSITMSLLCTVNILLCLMWGNRHIEVQQHKGMSFGKIYRRR